MAAVIVLTLLALNAVISSYSPVEDGDYKVHSKSHTPAHCQTTYIRAGSATIPQSNCYNESWSLHFEDFVRDVPENVYNDIQEGDIVRIENNEVR